MPNTVPYEVIAAPYKVYVAPVGTAFPAIDAAPGVSWTLVGSSGDLNYDDATGVIVEHRQTTVPWRALGDAGSRKIFRTEEDLIVKLKLVDITLEQYAHALNANTVTENPGERVIGLSRGFDVDTRALLVRAAVSPYQAEGNTQYEIPRAAQVGSPTVTKKKGEPEGLDLEWMALVDPNAATEDVRFGVLRAADDTAT
jgi:hypothetical protein